MSVCFLVGWFVASGAQAQQPVAADTRSSEDTAAAHALLARPITVRLTRAPLAHAVDLVSASAKIRMVYQRELTESSGKLITLSVSHRPLGAVLNEILDGTGLVVVPLRGGQIALAEAKNERNILQGEFGAIVGTVTEGKTRSPLRDAMVTLDDSVRRVRTDAAGRYRIAAVPVGAHRVTVRYLGFARQTRLVTVVGDQTATADVILESRVNTLSEVVTTATGDRKRVEVGNSIGTIKADSIVPTTLIRNVSDLLQARVPGVIVSNTDGSVGAPSKIRIRGVNSLVLNNDPIVIVDGVRLNAQNTSSSNQTNVGVNTLLRPMDGHLRNQTLAPSRLDDIDPNTIESIDVLRGPSASSLYGTDAANGVIIIKTKRGYAGRWRLNVLGDQGRSFIPGQLNDFWWGFGETSGRATALCTLAVGGEAQVTRGTCTQDSVRNFNYENNSQMRTLGTGTSQSLAANLSGGSEQLQQFFSLRTSNQIGMAKMSSVQQRLISRLWNTEPPSWMKRPNSEQDMDGSSRTTFHVSPQALAWVTATGYYRNVLNGGTAISIPDRIGAGYTASDTLGLLTSDQQRTKITSVAKHGTLSGHTEYSPWPWAPLKGTVGGDYALRTDGSDIRSQDCTFVLQQVNGGSNAACPSGHAQRQDETFVKTADASATLSMSPTHWLTLQTSLGEQYTHTDFHGLQAGNNVNNNCYLAFGTTLLTPSPVCQNPNTERYLVEEFQDEAATAGWYLEEYVELFGMHTTFGFRRDVASGFGGEVNKSPPYYPKFNVSIPLSDKSFFPKQSWVSSLRLRVSYGQSGNVTSQTAVLNQYASQKVAFDNQTAANSGAYVFQLGNPNLKPERGTEWDGGFDLSLLENERIRTEVTLYKKFTRDAINFLPLSPSYGIEQAYEYVNLGNVENRGAEISLNAKILDFRPLTWDLTVNYTKNTNRLVHKSPALPVFGPSNTQLREGYPLFGFWGSPILSYSDQNQDGILSQSEIVFGAPTFIGVAYPRSNVTYSSGVGLLNGALRVNVNLDQVNGMVSQKTTGGQVLTRGAVDPTSSLAEQAGYLQAVIGNGGAYLRQSSTLRLNELSATYIIPPALTRRFLHASTLSVTFAGRNLALWTNYIGKDPNVDTVGRNEETTYDEGTGLPQPRNLVMRFNLGL